MWEAIIVALLPVLVKLIGMGLDKIQADKEAVKAFLDFVQKMEKKANIPMKLHGSYKDQLEKLKNLP